MELLTSHYPTAEGDLLHLGSVLAVEPEERLISRCSAGDPATCARDDVADAP